MRKGKVYLAALALAGVLSACQAEGREDTALTPTGYASEEVQRISVYYGGALYLYTANGFDGALEDGFEKVGEIEKTDNSEYPTEELCGTHLEVGQEVYACQEEPSRIYVKYENGYAAFERQDTEELPAITAAAALISPAAAVFPMRRTGQDIEVLADVNHDGKEERVLLGLAEYAKSGGMESSRLRVLDGEDAAVLWEQDYGTAHAGWSMLYLYREDGKDYLVSYSPYMSTGLGSFQLSVFSLDDLGEPVSFKSCEAEFSLTRPDTYRSGFYGDAEEMVYFLELAVIWSAPFVVDIDNHMDSICECYQLSAAAIERLAKGQ